MDCFDLPALGSESSDLPDEIIQNGSNQNSCNTIGDEDKSNQRDVEMEPEVVDPDKLKRETKEKILNSYKEGLKLFGLGSLIEAEEIFQSILDDPFLQLVGFIIYFTLYLWLINFYIRYRLRMKKPKSLIFSNMFCTKIYRL